jgi:hypothetical protein
MLRKQCWDLRGLSLHDIETSSVFFFLIGNEATLLGLGKSIQCVQLVAVVPCGFDLAGFKK